MKQTTSPIKPTIFTNRDPASRVTPSVIYARMAFLAGLVIVLTGCAGIRGGGFSSTFFGHYLGNWTNSVNSHVGTTDFTIAGDGHVTGTLHDSTSSVDFTVTGSFDNSNNFTGTIGADTLTGVLANSTQAAQVHLTGTLEEVSSQQITASFNMDIVKQ